MVLDVGGHDVRVSHPGKVVFPEPGLTKLTAREAFLSPTRVVAAEEAVGAVSAVGRPLDPPEDPPHATHNNASSTIVGP